MIHERKKNMRNGYCQHMIFLFRAGKLDSTNEIYFCYSRICSCRWLPNQAHKWHLIFSHIFSLSLFSRRSTISKSNKSCWIKKIDFHVEHKAVNNSHNFCTFCFSFFPIDMYRSNKQFSHFPAWVASIEYWNQIKKINVIDYAVCFFNWIFLIFN